LYDLDDLGVVVTGRLDRAQFRLADMTSLTRNLCGKPDSGLRFRIVRCAAAIGGDLCVIQLGEVLRQIRVRRKAVAATVDLGDRQSDPMQNR
jgi:hypothetical protein